MRASWCVGAALAASFWSGTAQAQARYPENDGYGGGLIEYLVTGNVGSRGGSYTASVGTRLGESVTHHDQYSPAPGCPAERR